MKQALQFSLSLSLGILVLLGSGGITLGKMICGDSGCSAVYSLGKAKDCCDTNSDSPDEELESCCCELVNVSLELDEFSVTDKPLIQPQALTTPFLHHYSLPEFTNFAVNLPHFAEPILSPQQYLHRIGSLLL